MLLSLLLVSTASVALPADPKEVRKQFVELADKQDRPALVELWKKNPTLVLPTIDRDLESSLAEIEKGAKPDSDKVKALHKRALFGASCAYEASGHPMIFDYTSSFTGWTAAQQKTFREGQKASGAAGQALQKKDGKTALEKGTECYQKAISLGDWWGAAMGLDAIGNAHGVLGDKEDALTALSQARMINHDLGLWGDEYGNLTAIASLCVQSERHARGRTAAQMGRELAEKLGDAEGAKQMAELEKICAEKLGK